MGKTEIYAGTKRKTRQGNTQESAEQCIEHVAVEAVFIPTNSAVSSLLAQWRRLS